jgi:Flp pilus assembly protein TadD
MASQGAFGGAGIGAGNFAVALNRAGLYLELHKFDEAEREYARAVALRPSDPTAQLGLAKLRYMRGDEYFARDLIAAAAADRNNGLLQLKFADILRQAGDLAGSEVLLRDLIARAGPAPELRSSLATVLHAAGQLQAAEVEARAAVSSRPANSLFVHNLVAVLLSMGRAEDAMPLIRVERARAPLDPSWIADEATAARLIGDPAYSVLYDYERLVRIYDLEPLRGFGSVAELNAALEASLQARHTLIRNPFDQSMRSGSQTMGNLVRDPDPAIQAALEAFREAIEDYRARLGTAPDHPLSAQNHGESRYAGCWSVQLRQHGFHVNHIHPEGWLSSAYYVAVPPEADDVTETAGWIKFGEPAAPVPNADAGLTVQPKPGRLVLFPSYMWHGTTAIRGTVPRLTMAFDVVTKVGGRDFVEGAAQS